MYIAQVENSRFCRPDILKKLTEAVTNAQVYILHHLYVGHRIYRTFPCYSVDATADVCADPAAC